MSVEIRLLLFSGWENPSITLDGVAADLLVRQIASLPPLMVRSTPEPYARMGYRGIEIITREDDRITSRTVVYAGAAFDPEKADLHEDRNRLLEQSLLARLTLGNFEGLQNLSWANIDDVGNETQIQGLGTAGPTGPCPSGPGAPGGKPWKAHMTLNNCYNFANDVLNTNALRSPAMPGNLAGRGQGTAEELKQRVHDAVVSDDLAFLGNSVPEACPADGHHLVLVMLREAHRATTMLDFHCVRRDAGGTWSHLDASGVPRNTDDGGHPIADITQAIFDGKPQLVGVYMAPANNPKIA